MENKYKTLASNTFIFAIGNVLVKLISFFLMPLYTSALTTSEYGVAELLNNTIEIVLPIVTLCIIEALFRFSIDKDADYSALMNISLKIILFGDAIVLIVCLIWRYAFAYSYAMYFFLLYATTSLYKLCIQFARGLGHIKRYAAYGVINSLLLVMSNIILILVLHKGIKGYLLSFSIGYGLAAFVAIIASHEYKYFSLRTIDRKLLSEMTKYSLPSIPNMLSWWVNSLSDRYIVLLFWGSSLTGLYTAASKLPAIINLVTSIFQQAWQYSTATEVNSTDGKKFFSEVFKTYAYLSTTCCVIVLLFNKFICKVLLQTDFYTAWRYVPILILAAEFGCIATYFGTFYNAIKNNKMLMVSTLIGAAVNICLNFLLIPKFDCYGASIATAISYFVIMIVRMLDVPKKVDIVIDYRRLMFQLGFLILSTLFSCIESEISITSSALCMVIIILSDYKLGVKSLKIVKRYLVRNNSYKEY